MQVTLGLILRRLTSDPRQDLLNNFACGQDLFWLTVRHFILLDPIRVCDIELLPSVLTTWRPAPLTILEK